MITAFLFCYALMAIWTDLRLFFREQLRRGLVSLKTIELRLVHVELVTGLSLMPRQLVSYASLELTGITNHHGVGIRVALALVAVAT
jgi:hypothetical protein